MSNVAVVVSSENSHYIGWQTTAFCLSSIRYLNIAPIVIVHATHAPLNDSFRRLADLGCTIYRAESYRQHPLDDYPPRNELGSLLVAAELDLNAYSSILFCESDLLFTGPLSFAAGVTGQYYSYLKYTEPRVAEIIDQQSLGISPAFLEEHYQIGVPYLIPQEILRPLSKLWIESLDRFPNLTQIDIMYAFGMVLAKMGIMPHTQKLLVGNQNPHDPLGARIIHYCYGDSVWNKRDYLGEASPFETADLLVDNFPVRSTGREILDQISFAAKFDRSALRRAMLKTSMLFRRNGIHLAQDAAL